MSIPRTPINYPINHQWAFSLSTRQWSEKLPSWCTFDKERQGKLEVKGEYIIINLHHHRTLNFGKWQYVDEEEEWRNRNDQVDAALIYR
ncbi:hypothetical protein ABKN59_009715 [Abortiporus biennis]